MKPTENSDCATCENYIDEKLGCLAFPCNIPKEYLTGEKKHRSVDKKQISTLLYTEKLPEL